MAHRPAPRHIPTAMTPIPVGLDGNPPALPLPAGMEPLRIDQPPMPNEREHTGFGNNVYSYAEPTRQQLNYFERLGFINANLAFLCFQIMIDHMAYRSPSEEFISYYPDSQITLACTEFTLNLIAFLMIKLCNGGRNGGFGGSINKRFGSFSMMEARRPIESIEGGRFLKLVMSYWPTVKNEGYHVFAITEKKVHSKNAETWVQSMRKKGRWYGGFSSEGLAKQVARQVFKPEHVKGIFFPHLIILHMLTPRTHYNEIDQDAPSMKMLLPEQKTAYAAVAPLYGVAANDDPVRR